MTDKSSRWNHPRWELVPSIRGLGFGLMTCIATAWFGYQALYGEGARRIVAIPFLVMGVATAVGGILEYVRPRPRRRRSLEKGDAG